MQQTSQPLQMTIFGISESEWEASTSSASEVHAKTCQWLDDVLDLLRTGNELEADYFLRQCGSHGYSDPTIFSWKTWLDSYQATKGKTSRSLLPSFTKSGWSLSNGTCLMLKTLESRKTASVSLSSVLEEEVDEKYFLSDRQTEKPLQNDPIGSAPTLVTMQGGRQEPKIIQRGRGFNEGGIHDVAPTVSSHSYHENNMVVESGLLHSRGFETRKDGISHCIKGAEGGSGKNFIKVSAVLTPDREEKRQNGRRIKEPDEPMFTLTAQDKHGVLVTRKGRGNEEEWIERDVATCLDANYYKGLDAHQARTGVACSACGGTGKVQFDDETGVGECDCYQCTPQTRIRKLTPLECWRLMGRSDDEFYRAKYLTKQEAEAYISRLRRKGKRDIPDSTRIERLSDSQLYKQAGNSLVPQIVTEIAKRFE